MTRRCKPHLNKFALGTLVARFAPLLAVEESPRLLAKNFPRKEDRRVSMTLAGFLTAALNWRTIKRGSWAGSSGPHTTPLNNPTQLTRLVVCRLPSLGKEIVIPAWRALHDQLRLVLGLRSDPALRERFAGNENQVNRQENRKTATFNRNLSFYVSNQNARTSRSGWIDQCGVDLLNCSRRVSGPRSILAPSEPLDFLPGLSSP